MAYPNLGDADSTLYNHSTVATSGFALTIVRIVHRLGGHVS